MISKRLLKIIIICFSIPILIPSPLNAASIKDRSSSWGIQLSHIEIYFDNKTSQVIDILDTISGNSLTEGTGGIYLIDGFTKNELHPQKAQISRFDEYTLQMTIDFGDPSINFECYLTCVDLGVLLKARITNLGKQPKHIEVRFGLPLNYNVGGGWSYWDGYNGFNPDQEAYPITPYSNMHSINAYPIDNKAEIPKPHLLTSLGSGIRRNMTIFPMNCVFNAQYGIAIGLDPNYSVTYYAGGVQPKNFSYDSFFYALRFVLDAEGSTEQGFIIYDFNPTYKQRAALNKYYAIFSSLFAKRDIDPRFDKAGTRTFLSQHFNILEEGYINYWNGFCVRYDIGWTWEVDPILWTA